MVKSRIKTALQRKTSKTERDRLCQAVMAAAEAAGKQFGDEGLVSYLQAQAVTTPSPFLTLLSKVMADEGEGWPVPVTRVEIVAPRAEEAADSAAEDDVAALT